MDCMARATETKEWMGDMNNFESIKQHFDSTSRFARIQRLHTRIAGRMLYIRYKIRSSNVFGQFYKLIDLNSKFRSL